MEVDSFKPSKRLMDYENQLTGDKKELIENGRVKETMTNVFNSAMSTDAATEGLANLNYEWEMAFNGSEASRLIGTHGKNLNIIFTSAAGSKLISTLFTTAHVLLAKAGEETRPSGLVQILSAAYSLFSSPSMPVIVDQVGGLVITAVNKDKAMSFAHQFWKEVQTMLADKSLDAKVNKCLLNVFKMIKNYQTASKSVPELKSTRSKRVR